MKTINLDLTEIDGNAFILLGAFRKQAKREGWTDEEINKVINEAKKSDYDNLVGTLAAHCSPNADGEASVRLTLDSAKELVDQLQTAIKLLEDEAKNHNIDLVTNEEN